MIPLMFGLGRSANNGHCYCNGHCYAMGIVILRGMLGYVDGVKARCFDESTNVRLGKVC